MKTWSELNNRDDSLNRAKYVSSSLANPNTNFHLWLAAIKPPMYTVAVMPIAVGSLCSFAVTGIFRLSTFLGFLMSSIFIIAWLNLSNDAFDFDTGVDKNKRESIVNLLGGTKRARNFVLLLAYLLLLLSSIFLFLTFKHDFAPVVAIYVAVIGGYVYQGPPFRLSYYGLGEPICFAAWFIGTTAAYYSQQPRSSSHSLLNNVNALFFLPFQPSPVLPAATLVAYLTTIILFCSHFHQIYDDRAVGKLSPIVRLGTYRASRVLVFAVIAFFVLELIFVATGLLPILVFAISLSTIFIAKDLAVFVWTHHDNIDVIRAAKYKVVTWHFAHGVLLSVGYLIVGARLPK